MRGQYTCAHCGVVFSGRSPCKGRKAPQFCSLICAGAARRCIPEGVHRNARSRPTPGREARRCEVCGAAFYVWASVAQKMGPRFGRYCGAACRNVARRRPPGRFWNRVDQSGGANACWPWQGAVDKDGYGRFRRDGKQEQAPRCAWELARGPIPAGLLVCHHCDNPVCCNPAHLFVGTYADNTHDAMAKGRWRPVTRRRNA